MATQIAYTLGRALPFPLEQLSVRKEKITKLKKSPPKLDPKK